LTPEEIYKKVDKVTTSDIVSEAKKLFVPSKMNLAIIGPFKEGQKFVQLLQ
jgi:predicted Zn-dependent peptidase